MDIKEWIKEMQTLRKEMCRLDKDQIYNYGPPNKGNTAAELQQAEKELGIPLDQEYAAFLRVANGWPEFFQGFTLFGTGQQLPQTWGQGKVTCVVCKPKGSIIVG